MFRMWRGKRRTRPGKNPTTAPPTTKQNHSHFRGELGNAGTLSRAQGGDIRLCNMRDIARTVITMLGLHRLFEVFESRDEGVGSYQG